MMLNRLITALILGTLLAAALGGCARMPRQTPVSVMLNADAGINPGEGDKPSPIVVKVYELKGLKAFNNASYFDFDDDTKLLGADLIASREYELTPGSEKKYDTKISSEAEYIGVVASFRNIQSATWRDSIELRKEKKNKLVIYVTGQAVRIQKMRSGLFGG